MSGTISLKTHFGALATKCSISSVRRRIPLVLNSCVMGLQAPKFESALPDSDPAAVYLDSVDGLNYDQLRAIQRVSGAEQEKSRTLKKKEKK